MINKTFPKNKEEKSLYLSEVSAYFDSKSVEELIVELKDDRLTGIYSFEVYLSEKYLKWEKSRKQIVNRTDLIKPYDPFGTLDRSEFGIDNLNEKIINHEPLSNSEVIEILKKLPLELTERFMQFKISEIDYDLISEKNYELGKESKETLDTVIYNGLKISGTEVTYLNQSIPLSYQQRQLLRALISRPNKLVASDILLDDPDILRRDKEYKNEYRTLSKLVSEVHRTIKTVIKKDCIFNEPNEGWRLSL